MKLSGLSLMQRIIVFMFIIILGVFSSLTMAFEKCNGKHFNIATVSIALDCFLHDPRSERVPEILSDATEWGFYMLLKEFGLRCFEITNLVQHLPNGETLYFVPSIENKSAIDQFYNEYKRKRKVYLQQFARSSGPGREKVDFLVFWDRPICEDVSRRNSKIRLSLIFFNPELNSRLSVNLQIDSKDFFFNQGVLKDIVAKKIKDQINDMVNILVNSGAEGM